MNPIHDEFNSLDAPRTPSVEGEDVSSGGKLTWTKPMLKTLNIFETRNGPTHFSTDFNFLS